MLVKTFVENFKKEKVMNTKINPNAINEYIIKNLEVKTYIPFLTKREIVETVIEKNLKVIDGIKKVDSISQYISFVVAMLVAHTNLEIQNPYEDYDILCESKLLMPIITIFKEDYDECDLLLKMSLASELEDNNTNVLIGNFLNKISESIGGFNETFKEKLDSLYIDNLHNINDENLADLVSLFNK